MPCSSRNPAVWNPGGRSCPIVCLITRGPANPTTAPGSARITSPCIAYDADTPPVVGLVRIETNGTRAARRRAISTEVLAICIRDRTPSCMREGVLSLMRSEEHTSELQSQSNLVCRLLLEKKNNAQLLL